MLDAAEQEFAKYGLSGARTEDIAAKTGVTKAMIYYYFKSKEQLYQAVLERIFFGYMDLIQIEQLEELSPEEALEKLVRGQIAADSTHPNNIPIQFHEALQNQGKYYKNVLTSDKAQKAFRIFTGIFERGMVEGCFRELHPQHTAINVLGACSMYFVAYENLKYLWQGAPLRSPEMIERHTQEVINLVLAGVRVQKDSK
ncbi:MAG: TetR/AcrR family transcriptional regulator [Cyanobacteriota bacterium]